MKHAHGDDVLKDGANTMLQTALSKGMIGLPIPHDERAREEMIGWVEEKVWASKLLTLFGLQALKVQAETDEQGNWKLTKNNARRFFSTDKDDFHDAGRNAYIAFRIWLLDCDAGWSVNERDAALCRSR